MYCQLDNLRRCLPGRIRTALDELPSTLDATYERALQNIYEGHWEYAHRLFQCIAVASRPLRIEELAEVLAFRFEAGGAPTLMADWRPENPGHAVLSICSSLIAIVTVDGSQVVQFSHFSVQEFLMSSRLSSGSVPRYYISLEPAHTILAQACLSVLLQLDNHISRRHIKEYPLALYAAQHWVDHAKFENVSSRVESFMQNLFDKNRPHFVAWIWLYDIDRRVFKSMRWLTPIQPNGSPIYYATLWDLPGMIEWLVASRSHDVNGKGGYYGTPLCAAAAQGHLKAAQALVKCGAHVNTAGGRDRSPLHWASDSGRLNISRLLLDLGADINLRDSSGQAPLSLALEKDHPEIVRLLRQHTAKFPAVQTQDNQMIQLPQGDRAIDSFLGFMYFLYTSFWFLWFMSPNGRIYHPDVEVNAQGTSNVDRKKRRALLVGISYSYSQSSVWSSLENPHEDVDVVRNLLVGELYGSTPSGSYDSTPSDFLSKGSMGIHQRTSPCSRTVQDFLTSCNRLGPIWLSGKRPHFFRRPDSSCDRSVN